MLSTIAIAQEKGEFNVFTGLTYPLSSGADLGATAGLEYVFAENFSAAPSFTYYFSGEGITNTQVDIDARYYLGDESFNWFVTAGIAFNSTSLDLGSGFGSVSASDTGFSGGAGALFSLGDSIDILAVVKYNTNGEGSVVPMIGASFSL